MIDDSLWSILIVSYQSVGHLPRCLNAILEQQFPRDRFEVLLWDNGSTDGTSALIREQYPWVRLFASPQNLGFAAANNRLGEYARGTYWWLLNPDTEAARDCLAVLDSARQDRPYAWFAAQLTLMHSPGVLQSAGIQMLRDGRAADRGYLAAVGPPWDRSELVEAGCGAALAVTRPAPGESLFPDYFFAYYEDVLACLRHRQRGGEIWYIPQARVAHAHGASSGHDSEFFHFHNERNRVLTQLQVGSCWVAGYCVVVLSAKCLLGLGLAFWGKARWRRVRTLAAAWCSLMRYLPRSIITRWGDALRSRG